MERIKRFLLDESAYGEAATSVILMAAAGILFGAIVYAFWTTGLEPGMAKAGKNLGDLAGSVPATLPSGS